MSDPKTFYCQTCIEKNGSHPLMTNVEKINHEGTYPDHEVKPVEETHA